MAEIDIAVSIINYKTAEMTQACVQSVLEDLSGTPELSGRVAIVDNASEDGSVEALSAWITKAGLEDRVTLVPSLTNTGFSGGHNQGIGAFEAAYYLVLNSDAILRPGFFRAIWAVAQAHPQAGLIAPRLEGEDGDVQNSCFRFHSPGHELIRGATTGPVTRLFKRYDINLGPDPAPSLIDWASFACILLNHAMIREIGPMDEGYFLYFEDTEYAWRARKAGWRIHRASDAVAVHFRGGSSDVKSRSAAKERVPGYYYHSRSRFYRQAYGPLGPLRANLMWYLGRTIAIIRNLMGHERRRSVEHEARDIWIGALNSRRPAPRGKP